MAFDDYVNPQAGLMTAATAAAVSPRARELLRRGAVYGLAGAMRAGDVVAAAARGAVRGARESVAEENGRAGGSQKSGGSEKKARTTSGKGGTRPRSPRSSSGPRSSSALAPAAAGVELVPRAPPDARLVGAAAPSGPPPAAEAQRRFARC